MQSLSRRTWIGVAGAALILGASLSTLGDPLRFLAVPGCLGIAAFYWQLAPHVAGRIVKLLSIVWAAVAATIFMNQLTVPYAALGVMAAAAGLGLLLMIVSLQPNAYPRPLWIGALVGLIVPLITTTVAVATIVFAATASDVAELSGPGVLIAAVGLVAAQSIGIAIAAFGTEDIGR